MGCASNTPETPDDNPVLLRTGEREVRANAFSFYLSINYPEISDQEQDPELLSRIYDTFERDLLIAQISYTLGFRVSQDQVDEFISSSMTVHNIYTLPEDEQALWRDEIHRRLTIQQFLRQEILDDVNITDEAVTRYYEEHQQEFRQEALYHLRFVQVESDEAGQTFRKELRKSKKLFQELAEQYAQNDGYDLAVALPIGQIPEPFRKSVVKMKPGQHTKVLPIKQGEDTYYYLLYLESFEPESQVPFEEAYARIRTRLERQTRQRLLDEKIRRFEKHVTLERTLENLPFPYAAPDQRDEV